MRGGYRQNAGRKKGFAGLEAEKAREFIAQRLVIEFTPIVDKAIEQAKEGNHRAREWLTERAYGKIQQDMEDLDFEPLIIQVVDFNGNSKYSESLSSPKTEEVLNPN